MCSTTARFESRQPAVRLIKWECPATAFLASLGLTNDALGPDINTRVRLGERHQRHGAAVASGPVALGQRTARAGRRAAGERASSLPNRIELSRLRTCRLPLAGSRSRPRLDARRVDRLELPPISFSALLSSKRQFSNLIPPRLAQSPTNLIDLSEYYNAALVQTWHPGQTANFYTNTLEELPPGLLQLGGLVFDVRGIVQLSGTELQKVGGQYPQQITGIKINQACRQLHFLQASGWRATRRHDHRQLSLALCGWPGASHPDRLWRRCSRLEYGRRPNRETDA